MSISVSRGARLAKRAQRDSKHACLGETPWHAHDKRGQDAPIDPLAARAAA